MGRGGDYLRGKSNCAAYSWHQIHISRKGRRGRTTLHHWTFLSQGETKKGEGKNPEAREDPESDNIVGCDTRELSHRARTVCTTA